MVRVVQLAPELLGQERPQKHEQRFEQEGRVQQVQRVDVFPQQPWHALVDLLDYCEPIGLHQRIGRVVRVNHDVPTSLSRIVQ